MEVPQADNGHVILSQAVRANAINRDDRPQRQPDTQHKGFDAVTSGLASMAQIDQPEIGNPSLERTRAASEVGAAIAHELSGPLTALLLYVGDLVQNSDRFPVADGDGQSLKQVADNALRETERVCSLIRRISDGFEAPLQNDTAVAKGRDVINWWSRAGHAGPGLAAPSERAAREPLTRREREVLQLVIEGCSNKEGGVRMQISYRTFECHRAEVMRKFGAKNVADLIRLSQLAPEARGNDQSGEAAQA